MNDFRCCLDTKLSINIDNAGKKTYLITDELVKIIKNQREEIIKFHHELIHYLEICTSNEKFNQNVSAFVTQFSIMSYKHLERIRELSNVSNTRDESDIILSIILSLNNS